jgi:hypothetical protein
VSLEPRLRRGLRDAAEDVRPDVEARVRTAIATGRRRRHLRRAGGAVGLIAVVALSVVGGLALSRWVQTPRPAARPAVTPSTDVPIPPELVGVYRRQVSRAQAGADPALAGTFELSLGADGILRLATPKAFDATFGDAEGQRFRIDGDVIVSGAFFDHCGESFAYLWTVEGGTLLLATTVEEPCRFRRVLFTGGPWIRISPGR